MATEHELAPVRSRLFGLIAEERIRAVAIPRPPKEVVEAYLRLTDLSSSVSDALDALGVGGAVAGSELAARVPGTRIAGPAITIRYVAESGSVGARIGRGERAGLADRDLYNVGKAGDVAVFDCGGCHGVSVMGGLSGLWARRMAIAGCIVDAGVRDVDSIRAEGVPVWSRTLTPTSGKHRVAAAEINGPVSIARNHVAPGDLVVADETGVCVVPQAHINAVLDVCLEAENAEQSLIAAIRDGGSPEEVAAILRPERW